MKVYICGIDGYLGWTFANYMRVRGHQVAGCDNLVRRGLVQLQGSDSVFPIADPERIVHIGGEHIDIAEEYELLLEHIEGFNPDAIIHLGQIPSAPYSMQSVLSITYTQYNNVIGTLNLLHAIKEVCPEAHLVKLGTMGEYGTPNWQISEGDIELKYKGRMDTIPFPVKPMSFYHLSKVHDSNNIRLACKLWGIRCTDVMQGIVYGTQLQETNAEGLYTRFDCDEAFGTVVNRFCAQAVIGEPLTIYGTGQHKRALLPLQDSMKCLDLICHNPAEEGQYRVFNQFEGHHSMVTLASMVDEVCEEMGIEVTTSFIENPRVEEAEHYYNPVCDGLKKIGYKPTGKPLEVIQGMISDLLPYKQRIEQLRHVIQPKTRWK